MMTKEIVDQDISRRGGDTIFSLAILRQLMMHTFAHTPYIYYMRAILKRLILCKSVCLKRFVSDEWDCELVLVLEESIIMVERMTHYKKYILICFNFTPIKYGNSMGHKEKLIGECGQCHLGAWLKRLNYQDSSLL